MQTSSKPPCKIDANAPAIADTTTSTAKSESSNEDSDENARPASRSQSRATRLPPDWMPSQEFISYATEKGLTQTEIIEQAESMRDWSLSSEKGKKLDWLAAWRQWIKRYLNERKPNAPVHRNRPNVSEQAAQLAAAKYGWDNQTDTPALGPDRDLLEPLLDS